jgi:hypothetical protein
MNALSSGRSRFIRLGMPASLLFEIMRGCFVDLRFVFGAEGVSILGYAEDMLRIELAEKWQKTSRDGKVEIPISFNIHRSIGSRRRESETNRGARETTSTRHKYLNARLQ